MLPTDLSKRSCPIKLEFSCDMSYNNVNASMRFFTLGYHLLDLKTSS